jgi:hypothetical protein
MTLIDYPDFQTHQAHADAIAATGAPLLSLHTVLAHATAVIPASFTTNVPASGKFTVGQTSYEIVLKVGSGGAAAPVCVVELFWTDSISGLAADYQRFMFFAGATGAEHLIHGHGPSNADQLVVSFTAGLAQITVNYSIMQSSRIYTKHLWRTTNPQTSLPVFSGFSFPPQDVGAGIILGVQDSVAANGAVKYLLPLYTGDVEWNGRDNGNVASMSRYFMNAEAETAISNNTILTRLAGASGFAGSGPSSMEGGFTLPRVQCSHQYNNLNTTTLLVLSANIIAKQE